MTNELATQSNVPTGPIRTDDPGGGIGYDDSKWSRLFNQVGAWFGRLLNPVIGNQATTGGAYGSMPVNDSGITFNDTRAMQISAVWSCVRLLAETTATLPLPLYIRDDDGGRQRATSHPSFALMATAPNPYMTALEFREAMTAQLALYGNAFAHIVRTGSGQVFALYPLRADRMQVLRMSDGSITYVYSVDAESQFVNAQGVTFSNTVVNASRIVLAPESIFHIKGFGTDGYVGYSPLAFAANTLGLTVAAERYAGKFFAGGGKPSGVLMLDRLLTKQQRADIRESFAGMAQSELGSLWVLEASMKYEAISIAPAEAQLLDSRHFSVIEIARYFRVPPHLIFDMEKSTTWGAGLEQQNMAFLQYSLMPYLKRWELACDKFLLSDDDRKTYYFEHLIDSLMRADSAGRADLFTKYANNGIMTRNEIRRAENLEALPGGDTLTVLSNLVPLEKVGTLTPAATPAAGTGGATP